MGRRPGWLPGRFQLIEGLSTAPVQLRRAPPIRGSGQSICARAVAEGTETGSTISICSGHGSKIRASPVEIQNTEIAAEIERIAYFNRCPDVAAPRGDHLSAALSPTHPVGRGRVVDPRAVLSAAQLAEYRRPDHGRRAACSGRVRPPVSGGRDAVQMRLKHRGCVPHVQTALVPGHPDGDPVDRAPQILAARHSCGRP